MARFLFIVFSFTLTLAIIIIVVYQTFFGSVPYHPVSPTPDIYPTNPVTSPPLTYTFLPFWNVSQVNLNSLNQYSHLAYFGLDITPEGQIKTRTTPTQTDPGWLTFNKSPTQQVFSQALSQGISLELVIKALDTQTINQFLLNDSSHQTLSNNLLKFLNDNQFSGINLDFEPPSAPTASVSAKFTQFVKTLDTTLNEHAPKATITIDIYPSAAVTSHLWDLEALSPHTDYFVIMAYDYYRQGSTHTGPVAPLYQPHTNKSILYHLKTITDKVEASKLILGIPLYGYQWQATQSHIYSPVFPKTGQSIPLKNLQTYLTSPDFTLINHYPTLSQYLVRQNQDSFTQIHFDPPESTKLKYDLVTSAGLAGIAYWALGYEPENFQIAFP